MKDVFLHLQLQAPTRLPLLQHIRMFLRAGGDCKREKRHSQFWAEKKKDPIYKASFIGFLSDLGYLIFNFFYVKLVHKSCWRWYNSSRLEMSAIPPTIAFLGTNSSHLSKYIPCSVL